MSIYNLVSFAGMFVLVGVAWLCSESKRTVNWRVIVWGIVEGYQVPRGQVS